jgi:alanyl-tRNA synthetase
MKTSLELRQKFVEFWTSKERDTREIPNVSLVPNVDSTLLFVNSGMFPLAPYLAGQKHPLGTRLCNFQRCLRPKYEEVLEVGDNRHTIFFEMMGNWSLGDFDKTKQIPWILELYVKYFGIDPTRLYVSVWGGDEKIPRDNVAINSWKEEFLKYGVEADFSEDITNIPSTLEDGKDHKFRIFPYGRGKNWWQRGEARGELGGPSSEIFYDLGQIEIQQNQYHINDDSGRFVEIGNNVFMEYFLDDELKWQPLAQKNIDFGGGFERAAMCVQNKRDIFETDLFDSILKKIGEISGKEYKTNSKNNQYTSFFRVIADHIRASTFIIADGITPSSKDQGYILRKFLRRMVRFGKKLNIENNFGTELAKIVVQEMSPAYPYLLEQSQKIYSTIEEEENKFRKTLGNGLKEIEKLKKKGTLIDGSVAFHIYETYGFPMELTLEEFDLDAKKTEDLISDFKSSAKIHQEKSRIGAMDKFKGGLADKSVEVTKLHTTHHILLKALQKILDPSIKQRGSNITGERLRIDFNYNERLTPEEIVRIENFVNEVIQKDNTVEHIEMPKSEAEKIGAEMEFGQKYPDTVSIYKITDSAGNIISMEFCGGPHVKSTLEISEGSKSFKIISQESIGSGLKRIKAKLI